jgi:D-alanine-D-alanine ligase
MSRILVLYGGMSPEHEVAIISALQVMNALKEAGHTVIPGYITKAGEWIKGDERFFQPEFYQDLQKVFREGKAAALTGNRNIQWLEKALLGFQAQDVFDAVFPVFHGSNGEDGTMQGLLTLAGVPFVGCGVAASATGMDKILSKAVARQAGLNVVEDVVVVQAQWEREQKSLINRIKSIGSSWFVKPATLGSSIGISYAKTEKELINALEVAFAYDSRVLVEAALENPVEVNISVMGNDPYEVSVTEQPVASSEVLSFEDKYLRNGSKSGQRSQGMASASRIIPAPISDKQTKEVQAAAEAFFRALGGSGIARIDFMYDKKGKLYFNEINTIPGSLAFYLWEKSGYPFPKMVDNLVKLALQRAEDKQRLVTTFQSNILSGYAENSAKGGKI